MTKPLRIIKKETPQEPQASNNPTPPFPVKWCKNIIIAKIKRRDCKDPIIDYEI